jgi:Tol biopolymer transport system component
MKRSFLAALLAALVAAPLLAQYFGQNKVRYDTFTWQVFPTPHFRISFYDRTEPLLPKLASFAESSYDDLARKLNFQIPEPVPLIAYATHAEFEQTNVIMEFIPEGVGAFATPARNRIVLPADLPDSQLQKLIQHELTHVFQYEILFQGKLSKALASRPPQWFMEGMASFFANDEDARASAVMRDAVLADRVPSVEVGFSGYLAYRYGNMVFKFVEAEWGVEGLRDFVFEFRNTLGGSISKTLKRAFELDTDEFDAKFRTWLRKYFQNVPAERGDPREFGQVFRIGQQDEISAEASPVASPSGDLVAAFSTIKEDADVVLIGVPNRKLYRNLTRGNTTRYQYLVAQLITTGPDRGRDLAYAPDGNHVAVFARREKGRELLLLSTLSGEIDKSFPIEPDQAMQPAYSPDGKTVAFHALAKARADIYLLDLATGAASNLTDDDAYDSDPTFTPDGKYLVYTSQSEEYSKLYQVSLANPKERKQLTFGAGDDEGAAFSRDGKRLYFASDRDGGILDIYCLDLDSRDLTRLTKVIGAALNPVAIPTQDGERVVFQGYSKGRWLLYVTDPTQGKPIGKEEAPAQVSTRTPYVPSVTVAVSRDKFEAVKKRKLYTEDVQILFGVNEDSTLISQTYLSFSDNYGDRRFSVLFESIDEFSNFNLSYLNLSKRIQWGVSAFDDRTYYTTTSYYNAENPERRVNQQYRITGAAAFARYPFSLYHRADATIGYISRSLAFPVLQDNGRVKFISISDDIPFVEVGLTGDTTFWQFYGPHAGRRYQLSASLAPDIKDGGFLSRDVNLDVRQYLPISSRNELAFRLYAAAAEGNRPTFYYFGGLDTMRGFDYRSLVGNRAAYMNAEWRFPLIDHLVLPWLHVSDVRGRLFFDLGGAFFDIGDYSIDIDGQDYEVPAYRQSFQCFSNNRTKDCVSSYGFGLSVNIFGLPAHWDFAKRWDLKDTLGDGYRTTFWIGYRF